MERLTFDDNGCNSIKDCENDLCRETCLKVDGCSDCPIKRAIDKLAEYEDMEEQGRLVKLPCKVGDTLYRIDVDPNMTEHDIIPYQIDNIVLCDDGDVLFKYDSYDGVICGLKALTEGEPYLDYYKVFLTMSEAEQALQQEQP